MNKNIKIVVYIELVLIVSGLFYSLNLYILLGLCMQGLIAAYLLNEYYKKENDRVIRLTEIDVYLHQMTYSFIRQPKIIFALKDTLQISDGELRKCIEKTLDELEYSYSEDVYEQAFSIVEDYYKSERIRVLNRFLISVENRGGRYINSIQVILKDIDRWINNIYQYNKDMIKIKRDIGIGILISVCLGNCTSLINIILRKSSIGSVDISDSLLYNLSSLLFLSLCLWFYVYSQVGFSIKAVVDANNEEKMIRNYKVVFENDLWRMTIKMLPFWGFLLLLSIVLGLFVNVFIGGFVFVSELLIIAFPFMQKGVYRKNLNTDIYTTFSTWLRDVALNLCEQPLQVAINTSYDECPLLIKSDLEQFIEELDQCPKDIMPFYRFMKKYELEDVSSSVKTLYSFYDMDQDNIDKSINTLISRNYEMIDRQEKYRREDLLSIMRFSEYIPTLFVSLKIGIDMVLILTNYL